MGDDFLLWGFAVYRNGGSGAHVPIAPAQCCQACLGSKIHRMDECRSLNRCSRRGICVRPPNPCPTVTACCNARLFGQPSPSLPCPMPTSLKSTLHHFLILTVLLICVGVYVMIGGSVMRQARVIAAD